MLRGECAVNLDVISGIVALLLAPFAGRSRGAAWIAGVVGFGLLLNVIRVAITSLPTPLQRFPGSEEIDVRVDHDEARGVMVIAVADAGEGMTREIIDSRLTRLFSSAKDGDYTKIGRFGIGFVAPVEAIVADDALPLDAQGAVDRSSKRYGQHVCRCRRAIAGLISALCGAYERLRGEARASACVLLLAYAGATCACITRRAGRSGRSDGR